MTFEEGKIVSIRRPLPARAVGFDVTAFPRFTKEAHNPGLRPEVIIGAPLPESEPKGR